MKSLILTTALILINLQGKLYSQSYLAKQMSKSKTEATFNANENLINIRDFVVLKEGRMILELSDVTDYQNFRNMDSLLATLMKDIVFYKDSLAADPTGHVRIDYVINSDYSFKKIRFKKYPSDGNIFMNQNGEVSKLKFEHDTVRIIIQCSKPGISRKANPCMIPYSVQTTFLLGNYYDVDRIIADNALKGIIDTLEKESQPKQKKKQHFPDPVTIIYNPYYSGPGRFSKFSILLDNEYDYVLRRKSNKSLTANVTIGAGLIRNTITPMADFGIQYNRYWNNNHNIFRLSASPYYFFDKDENGNYKVNNNWFVNIDMGSIYEQNAPGWFGKECTIGLGYLFYQQGGYFKNTTFKIFTDLQVIPWITIVPEVIVTDNFKQFFPGVTLKVF